jgi:hypothetical protein
MCIKIFRKFSSAVRSTYCVTKVLFQYLEVPLSVYSNISPVMHELIVLTRTSSTKVGIQTDTRQTTIARDEYSGRKESTSSVNHKLEASKEKFSKDVLEYLNSKDYLKSVLHLLHQKLLKRKKSNPDALYTVDRDVASKCRCKCCWRVRGSKSLRFFLLFNRLLCQISVELYQFLDTGCIWSHHQGGQQHVK